MTNSASVIDDEAVGALLDRARADVDSGHLPACQVALAKDGELVAFEAFGDATTETRFAIFSATKPFVASVVWLLLAEGELDESLPVTTWFPEFAGGPDAEAKASITLEQVMLHTSGFPHAPMGPPTWSDRDARVERMASWKLNWEPGTRYEYHPSSAHWVLAELIDRVMGEPYTDMVESRITGPAGLSRVLGLSADQQDDIADLVLVGDEASPDELEAAFGVRELPATEVTDDAILRFNTEDARSVGIPGGGGFATAADLALFYQHLMHNPNGVWDNDHLADLTSRVRNEMPDPMGVPANRSLGLILAGDDGQANMRGLGRTVSPAAFGHNGAGGQLAWADPATGLSLGYVTNGYDRHILRMPRRGTAIGSLAGVCTVAP